MPFVTRRRFRRRRAPARRRVQGLATVPRMMPRTYAMRRKNQVATKVFWFKLNGQLSSQPILDYNYFAFRSRGFTTEPGGGASTVPQRDAIFSLYDQFKVLAISVKWFPCNVGTEPGQVLSQGIFNRGDHVIWSDQRFDDSATIPIQISEVLNHGSARMIQPRRFQARTMYRPKGHPEWGSCEAPQTIQDSWNGAIQMLVNNVTPARPLWYYTLTYKVLVRGRRQN